MKDRNEKIAITFMNAINCFGINEKKVTKYMSQEHRTLQQSFTRICVEWLKTLSETQYFDDRNKASVEFAKALMSIPEVQELLEHQRFPMI